MRIWDMEQRLPLKKLVQLGRTNETLRKALSSYLVNRANEIEGARAVYHAQEACELSEYGHRWDAGFEDGRDMGARCVLCGKHEE